jgi:hypothetical protein
MLSQSLGTPANGGAIRCAYIDRTGVIWILDIVEPSYDKWAPFLVELLCLFFLEMRGLVVRAFCCRPLEEKDMGRPKDNAVALSWHERATMEARTVLEAIDTPLELTDVGETEKQPKRDEILSGELSLTFVMKPRECDGA